MEKIAPILKRLRELIAESDSEAGDVAAEAASRLEGSAAEAQAKRICVALETFDYDAAMAEVDALIQVLTPRAATPVAG
jgi:hypothetical protein